MNGPVLNEHDRQSALWKKLQAHLEARLQQMRERNDSAIDVVRTAKLRGRIAEIKYLLSLDEEQPIESGDE